jgi:hypothetical protein
MSEIFDPKIIDTSKKTPLVVIRDIIGKDYLLHIAYLPLDISKKECIIDKSTIAKRGPNNSNLKTLKDLLESMEEQHVWDIYMAYQIADFIEQRYKPLALYVLMEFTSLDGETEEWPKETIAIVRGEMEKDWDLKMEALRLIQEGIND